MKQVLYIDMDNVLVDFQSGIDSLDEVTRVEYVDKYDAVPGIFALMKCKEGAVEAFNELCDYYDVYILSTAPWDNPSAWSDKLTWVKENLGEKAYKRLILSHHKDLAKGDYLIDDRTKNGASEFEGELIIFGSEEFPNWKSIVEFLVSAAQEFNLSNTQDTFNKMEDSQNQKDGSNYSLISPLQEGAFTEPVMRMVVLSKIDFELPDEIWNKINEEFAHYWDVEVGYGNFLDYNDACSSIDRYLKRNMLFFSFDKLVRIIEIMLDFIGKIPGAILDDDAIVIPKNNN